MEENIGLPVDVQKTALTGINLKIGALELKTKIIDKLSDLIEERTVNRDVIEAIRHYSLSHPR